MQWLRLKGRSSNKTFIMASKYLDLTNSLIKKEQTRLRKFITSEQASTQFTSQTLNLNNSKDENLFIASHWNLKELCIKSNIYFSFSLNWFLIMFRRMKVITIQTKLFVLLMGLCEVLLLNISAFLIAWRLETLSPVCTFGFTQP